MVFEKTFLRWLQDILLDVMPIFYGEAPQNQKEPFAVLQTILTGASREVNVMRPLMQLDVFTADQFQAVELAETAIDRVMVKSMASDGLFFSCLQAERTNPIRVEDGTWKVPVEIRFAVKAR